MDGASNIRVFGSMARGEATNTSDLDLLIDLEPKRSLFDLIDLKQELEDLLNCQVDLAEPHSLHQLIRDRVLQEGEHPTFALSRNTQANFAI